jgi:hypothetical protein
MQKFQVFHNCVLGVDSDGTAVLVVAPPKLYRLLGGPYLSKDCQRAGFDSMRGRPGLYRATIECRWEPSSRARVHDGEDAVVALTARELEAEAFESLAIARCDVVMGYAPAHQGLTALLAQVGRRVWTQVLHDR